MAVIARLIEQGTAEGAVSFYPCDGHYHIGHRSREQRGRR